MVQKMTRARGHDLMTKLTSQKLKVIAITSQKYAVSNVPRLSSTHFQPNQIQQFITRWQLRMPFKNQGTAKSTSAFVIFFAFMLDFYTFIDRQYFIYTNVFVDTYIPGVPKVHETYRKYTFSLHTTYQLYLYAKFMKHIESTRFHCIQRINVSTLSTPMIPSERLYDTLLVSHGWIGHFGQPYHTSTSIQWATYNDIQTQTFCDLQAPESNNCTDLLNDLKNSSVFLTKERPELEKVHIFGLPSN